MNCEICGKKVNDSDIIKIDDLNYCQSCFDDIFSYCDDCDDVTERDQLTQVDNGNRVVCRYCLEEYYIRCNDCGEYYRVSDMSWYLDEYRLCQSCVDENYVTCESCGELAHYDNISYDDDSECPICDSCREEHSFRQRRNDSRGILHYGYKPIFEYYGDNNGTAPYYGIELEIDRGGYNGRNAKTILNGEPSLYPTYDNCCGDGFEITSHPATLEYHLNLWPGVLERCRKLRYVSHNADSCGLHVHIGRRELGSTDRLRREFIKNIILFFETNWTDLIKFSRRTESQWTSWCKSYMRYVDRAVYDDQIRREDRYNKNVIYNVANTRKDRTMAVNITNDKTVEIRIFRGTIKTNSFIAALQFLDNLINLLRVTDDDDIPQLNIFDVVDHKPTTELKRYMRERGFYVNPRDLFKITPAIVGIDKIQREIMGAL